MNRSTRLVSARSTIPPLFCMSMEMLIFLETTRWLLSGARRPSPYGNQMAERLGRDLASRGLVVVSGLARGVDANAQRGALSAVAGSIVAILGCGVDVVYPKENKKIYDEIRERGALVSEFPLGTFPAPQNFLIRNRIIAGMVLGVVVVEAARCSGSLITARLAMEFGREVYRVPGNATRGASNAGTGRAAAGRIGQPPGARPAGRRKSGPLRNALFTTFRAGTRAVTWTNWWRPQA
jgi:DNA protecting protein DprA